MPTNCLPPRVCCRLRHVVCFVVMQSSARAGHVVLPTHRDFGPPTNRLKKIHVQSPSHNKSINRAATTTCLRPPRGCDDHAAATTTWLRPPRGGATRTDFARLRILSYNYRNTTFETRAPRVWGVLQPRGATSYMMSLHQFSFSFSFHPLPNNGFHNDDLIITCLLYTSPSPRDRG